MPHLLILARGDAGVYRSRDGQSLLAHLPFDVTLFADQGNGFDLRALEGEHEIQVVHWHDEPAIVARARLLHTGVPFTAVATFDRQLATLAGQVGTALGLAATLPAMPSRPPSPSSCDTATAIVMQTLLDAAAVREFRFVQDNERAGSMLH